MNVGGGVDNGIPYKLCQYRCDPRYIRSLPCESKMQQDSIEKFKAILTVFDIKARRRSRSRAPVVRCVEHEFCLYKARFPFDGDLVCASESLSVLSQSFNVLEIPLSSPPQA